MTEPELDGWVLRELKHGDQLVRWIERPIEGRPGVVERRYADAPERLGAVVAGGAVLSARQLPKPVAVLSAEARRSIVHAAVWRAGQGDNRELGGVLYGEVRDDGVVEITRAREASMTRGSWFVSIDMDRASGRLGERAVGDFHTHTELARASDQDMRVWRALARRSRPEGDAPFIGIIVVVRRYGEPQLNGYATDWRGDTKPILL